MTDVDRFPTSTVADVLGPACALDRRIAPVVPGTHLAGRALPVLARDGDNGPVAAAIAAASPGDVLVVDGGAGQAVALLGGLLARRALLAGVAGAVVDGLVRDVDELRALGLPVYARAARRPCRRRRGDRRPPAGGRLRRRRRPPRRRRARRRRRGRRRACDGLGARARARRGGRAARAGDRGGFAGGGSAGAYREPVEAP